MLKIIGRFCKVGVARLYRLVECALVAVLAHYLNQKDRDVILRGRCIRLYYLKKSSLRVAPAILM